MKEIEILVEVYDGLDKVNEVLKNFDYKGTSHVIDEYYYDPKRDDLKPDDDNKIYKCLRIRQNNDNYTITYKDDVYENKKWIYSNEYETKIESIETMRDILKNIGLVKFIEINNEKDKYIYNNYEIVLEKVDGLGLFMEVEYCTKDDVDVKKIKENIQEFIDSLGIKVSEELNMGKPEMFLKKYNIKL